MSLERSDNLNWHASHSVPQRGHIRELDGLRGIAILLVMAHHFWPSTGMLTRVGSIAHMGWIGVDLFFVISGFLITGILLDTKADQHYFGNFYARRSLRIFPLYYLVLGIAFTAIPLVEGGPYTRTEFIRESGSPWWYILYAGNIREAIAGREPAYVLAVLWSLAIEEQFYISFPLIVRAMPPRRLGTLLIGMILFAPTLRFVTTAVWPQNERVQYLATLCRVDVIAWGALIAMAFRMRWSLPSARASGTTAAAALLVMFIVASYGGLNRTRPFGRTIGYSVVAVTFASIVLCALQSRETKWLAWLRTPPLTTLGRMCYGIYLLQRPAEVVLTKVVARAHLPLQLSGSVGLVLKCAAALTAATISWVCFEQPILRLKRFFASRHHPVRDGRGATRPISETPPTVAEPVGTGQISGV